MPIENSLILSLTRAPVAFQKQVLAAFLEISVAARQEKDWVGLVGAKARAGLV